MFRLLDNLKRCAYAWTNACHLDRLHVTYAANWAPPNVRPDPVSQTAESAKSGFGTLLMFTAFLSLNLGFLNILPIPVLDGGHIVFLGIEAIKRKPLSIKTRLVIQQVGMAFLLALMAFIIFNDIARFL